MTNSTPVIFIDLYAAPKNLFHSLTSRPQRWRWRARNALNNRILANSADAYTNKGDALAAIDELFGTLSDVYLRQAETGDQMLRLATQLDG